jgi:hypothetical protein
MNARRTFVLVALLILAALLWFLLPKSKPVPPLAIAPSPKSSVQTREQTGTHPSPAKDAQGRLLPVAPNAPPESEKRKESEASEIEMYRRAFSAPISFYGKVLDERGNPIEGATAKLIAIASPLSNGTTYERISDAQGLFAIAGIHGIGLVVRVTKAGYYPTDQSKGKVSYGKLPTTDERAVPTPDAPAIFVLRKMGETVPLVHLKAKDYPVDGKGTAVEVNLATGAQARGNGSQLRVEVWSDDPTYGARGPYGWHARVTVPGGGLIERQGEIDFEAPADGYTPSFETSMARNAERWRDGFDRQFFACLADGRYARFSLSLTTGGLFFRLESFLNPTPGNRNLEFDPAKAITPKP